MKACRKCLETKPLDAFYKNAARKDGHQTMCKECEKEASRKHWHSLTTDEKREKHYRRFYNIGVEAVTELLKAQDGCCGICGDVLVDFHIDHNHDTGEVRGILCSCCNTGLGKLKDSVSVLSSAIDYLKRNGSYERQSTRGAETSP